MNDTLEKKLAAFSKLVEMAAAINASLDPDDVLPSILDVAQHTMDAAAASVALVDDATQELVYILATGSHGERVRQSVRLKMGEGIAGWVACHGESLVLADVVNDPRFNRAAAERAGIIPRSMICVPMRMQGKIIGVLQALDPLHKPCFDQDDGTFFDAFASFAATAITNAQLHKALLRQQSEQQEREFARQIQRSFLPREMPPLPGVSLHARSDPAMSVGGDFYDVIQLTPSKITLIIGDITGKGFAASLYMVRCLFETRRACGTLDASSLSPGELLTMKNRVLACEVATRLAAEMRESQPPHTPIFLGMFCATFDSATGELRYANAGMPDPLISAGGSVETLASSGGPPLGMLPEMTYQDSVRVLRGGETLLLFTDGLTEARNLGGIEFGSDRLAEALAPPHADAMDAVEAVSRGVRHFVGSAELHDDLTMLALHFGGI